MPIKKIIAVISLGIYFLGGSIFFHASAMNIVQTPSTDDGCHSTMESDHSEPREDDCYENCMGTYDEVSSYSMTEEKNQITTPVYSQKTNNQTTIFLKTSHTQRKEEGGGYSWHYASIHTKITKKIE